QLLVDAIEATLVSLARLPPLTEFRVREFVHIEVAAVAFRRVCGDRGEGDAGSGSGLGRQDVAGQRQVEVEADAGMALEGGLRRAAGLRESQHRDQQRRAVRSLHARRALEMPCK